MENYYSDLLKSDVITGEKNKASSKVWLKNAIENNKTRLDSSSLEKQSDLMSVMGEKKKIKKNQFTNEEI